MTATKTDTPWCAEHRRPLPDCRPDVKHVHPMRFRTDMWADADRVALAAGTDRTALVRRLLEVALGYIRCEKCDYRSPDGPGIPVEFGDLTGLPLGEWIARAAEQVARQHPDHEPVIVGVSPASGRKPRASASQSLPSLPMETRPLRSIVSAPRSRRRRPVPPKPRPSGSSRRRPVR